MRILGIVSRTHDSGLALLERGVPTLILEEERFNREKHTRKFPFRSLKAAFDDRGLERGLFDAAYGNRADQAEGENASRW
jgi:carbamoyltransferase